VNFEYTILLTRKREIVEEKGHNLNSEWVRWKVGRKVRELRKEDLEVERFVIRM
jgi:hypothetical protein